MKVNVKLLEEEMDKKHVSVSELARMRYQINVLHTNGLAVIQYLQDCIQSQMYLMQS